MSRNHKRITPLADRFWARVEKTPGCWVWTGYRSRSGYGMIGRGNRSQGIAYAHRVSWELAYGDIPQGMAICHHCDNPACVRPDHLFLGTIADNNHDMQQKGHINNAGTMGLNFGEANGNGKLTEDQVIEMRALYASGGYTFTDIANRYGINISTASRIIQRKSWQHIP